ncbi:MAG TPA: hypothetical protein VJ866_14190 [Pyrinomonadaceae bacterium]|nr:hypothetical protein [Pyrinomonadaceae bacterium]
MTKYTNPLENVRVAAPCPADWEKMVGDERVRYCNKCELHVYNLSGMTRREAEALLSNTEGRLCVRFYRRDDGTILTRNCPVGLAAFKRRVSRVAGATLSAVLGFFAGLGLNFGLSPRPFESGHTMGAIGMPAEQRPVSMEPAPPDVVPIQGAISREPQVFMGKRAPIPVNGPEGVEEIPVRPYHRRSK